MNDSSQQPNPRLRPINYWWLWLGDTVLVSAGCWFYLATHYGTYEFYGVALMMASLALIPVLVLVGGAGSTVFALTKIWIEKRGLPRRTGVALLVGPALMITLALGLLGAFKSPAHRLAFICAGHPPAAAGEIRIAGYSAFLRGEWLAVFRTEAKSFQSLVTQAQLVPADAAEFQNLRTRSDLKFTRLFQTLPPTGELKYFKRVFKEAEEHERGIIFAVFDPATGAAAVFRSYHD